jgi:hypothetical protein
MSLTKKMPKNRSLANNSHGDVDAEAADADARLELVDAAAAADARLEPVDAAAAAADSRLELVDAAAAAADARLELVDAAAAAVADRLPLAAQPLSLDSEASRFPACSAIGARSIGSERWS